MLYSISAAHVLFLISATRVLYSISAAHDVCCFTGCDVDLALPSGRCSNYTPLHMALDNYSTRDLFEAVLKLLLTGRCNLDSQAFPTLEAPLYR